MSIFFVKLRFVFVKILCYVSTCLNISFHNSQVYKASTKINIVPIILILASWHVATAR